MFANSTLYQNGAGTNGGGLYLDTGTASLTNVSVTSNTAAADGSGFYVRTNRTLTVVQGCTVSGNTANSGNGGYKQPNATLTENRNNNAWEPTTTSCKVRDARSAGPRSRHALRSCFKT